MAWNDTNGFEPRKENGNPFEQNGFRAGGPNPFGPGTGFADNAARDSLSTYIGKTFLWMFGGLLLTFIIAYGMAARGIALRLLSGGGIAVLIGVSIAEILCVVIMSARFHKLSPTAAALFFFAYAALTGVTFSMYFVMFDVQILVYAFGATAVFFGGMAAASLIFKMELSTIRPYLFGGLIFLILFGILSMFLNLGAFNTMLCYIGIAVFLGYTAYDTAKIKENYNYYYGDAVMLQKASVFAALQLYLDFINLFLYILRILASRRRN